MKECAILSLLMPFYSDVYVYVCSLSAPVCAGKLDVVEGGAWARWISGRRRFVRYAMSKSALGLVFES